MPRPAWERPDYIAAKDRGDHEAMEVIMRARHPDRVLSLLMQQREHQQDEDLVSCISGADAGHVATPQPTVRHQTIPEDRQLHGGPQRTSHTAAPRTSEDLSHQTEPPGVFGARADSLEAAQLGALGSQMQPPALERTSPPASQAAPITRTSVPAAVIPEVRSNATGLQKWAAVSAAVTGVTVSEIHEGHSGLGKIAVLSDLSPPDDQSDGTTVQHKDTAISLRDFILDLRATATIALRDSQPHQLPEDLMDYQRRLDFWSVCDPEHRQRPSWCTLQPDKSLIEWGPELHAAGIDIRECSDVLAQLTDLGRAGKMEALRIFHKVHKDGDAQIARQDPTSWFQKTVKNAKYAIENAETVADLGHPAVHPLDWDKHDESLWTSDATAFQPTTWSRSDWDAHWQEGTSKWWKHSWASSDSGARSSQWQQPSGGLQNEGWGAFQATQSADAAAGWGDGTNMPPRGHLDADETASLAGSFKR